MSAALDAGEMIFGALGTRLAALAADLERAPDVGALARLAPAIPALGAGLVAGDAGSALATRVTTALNDRLGARAVALVAAAHRLPVASWCWLAFGSEGRAEQTFVTDQDNGLVFSAEGSEAHALRQLFQPFAQAVNEALAACGVPLCPGGIMAGNSACCLSLEEWRRRFAGWIRTPDPQALLNAAIFFDFRALHGEAALAERLRERLLHLAAANDAFIRMMAGNALTVAPPLGLLGDIAADDGDGIDLKKEGTRLFVDAARVFALAGGLPAVGTAPRLLAAAQAGMLEHAQAKAASQAFGYLQHLRLARQAEALASGRAPDNRVRRGELGEFERRAAGAALKQARSLQQHMKLAFRIEA